MWRLARVVPALCLLASVGFGSTAIASVEATADESPESPENADLDDYVKAYGVSADEALLEWAAADAAGAMQVELVSRAPEIFAGMWIERDPKFTVVVGVVAGGAPVAMDYIREFDLSDWTTIREMDHTLAEPRSYQERLSKAAPFGVDFSSGIDQSEGIVQVTVSNDIALNEFTKVGFPSFVEFAVADLPTPADAIYGGLPLDTPGCTTGFSVEETGTGTRQGVTTAGHCTGAVYYSGVHLDGVANQYSGRVDARWMTTPGFTDPNAIQVSSNGTTRNVTSRKPLNQMMENDAICKYGRTTHYDCGEIKEVYYDPGDGCVPGSSTTYILITPNPNAGSMTEGGDSGGPAFHGNPAKAFATLSCKIDGNDDGIAMPQNFLTDIGVQVDITV